MRKVIILLLSFFVFFSFTASGQYYNFQNYTVEDGLPQSQVKALYQDDRSNLWVGTNGGGLARFNGREFKVFRRTDGLFSDRIEEITSDTLGNILIKSDLGITVFNGKEFINYPFTDGNLAYSDRMIMDKTGHFWFRFIPDDQNAIIYMFDGNTFHNMSGMYEELKEHGPRNGLTADAEGNILISAGQKLFIVSEDQISLHPINALPEFAGRKIGFLYKTVDDRILVAASSEKES